MTAVRVDAGLCGSCIHARTIESSRGSTFLRCDLSFVDARYPRYPPLPIVACEGHRQRDDDADGEKRRSAARRDD